MFKPGWFLFCFIFFIPITFAAHDDIVITNNGAQYYLPDAYPQGNFYMSILGLQGARDIRVHCIPKRCVHVGTHYSALKVLHFGHQENILIHTKHGQLQRLLILIATARLKNEYQDSATVSFISMSGALPNAIVFDSSQPAPTGPSYMTVVTNCQSAPHNAPCQRY